MRDQQRFGFSCELWHNASMSETKIIKNPSPLVLSILALDEHFSEMARLAGRIDEMDLKSNFDFEQSERLINLFAECGQAVSGDIAKFVAVLNEDREKTELAAQKVAIKADQLKERKDEIQEKMAHFHVLSGKVSQLNETLLTFKKPQGETMTDEDRALLATNLGDIELKIQTLILEAQELKEVGQQSKIKILEQNADSMRQTLIAVSQKLISVKPQITSPTTSPTTSPAPSPDPSL